MGLNGQNDLVFCGIDAAQILTKRAGAAGNKSSCIQGLYYTICLDKMG